MYPTPTRILKIIFLKERIKEMLDSIELGYEDGIFFPEVYLDFDQSDNIFICDLLPLIDIDEEIRFDNVIDIYILKA